MQARPPAPPQFAFVTLRGFTCDIDDDELGKIVPRFVARLTKRGPRTVGGIEVTGIYFDEFGAHRKALLGYVLRIVIAVPPLSR